MSRLTLKTVNKAIAEKGIKAELVKGPGYFYFIGDAVEVGSPSTTTVWTYRLNNLTIERWLSELDQILEMRFL